MLQNDQPSAPRPPDARKLLSVLKAAKSYQDSSAQPGRGRGLWLSNKLWHSVTKFLELQALEMEALQLDLEAKDQEAERLRQQAELDRAMQQRVIEGLQTQAVQLRQQAVTPLVELGSLQAQMREKQEAWDRQKSELESQADRMMELLRGMGILAGSNGSNGQSEGTGDEDGGRQGLHGLGGFTLPAHVRLSDYHQARADYGLTAPDAQALHIKELSLLLAEARQQVETYRRQLAARSLAPEDLVRDIKRLKADNQRLVALLAKVPEYRALAAEVAAESGSHYVPLEECLMIRGLVEDLHPPLLDRPVEDVTGWDLAGPGRLRDPDGPDPSLTLVLDEQYHWVPRKALETGAALMRRMMPALPMSQLLVLVAELNKVWRDRERQRLAEVAAVQRQELRKLQQTFQQRAPYEAVVAGQKINDLKRRMRAQAAQVAAVSAAAKKEQKRTEDDSKVMLQAGLSSIQDLSKQVATLVKRNKKLAGKATRQRALAAAATAAAASARMEPLCSACLDRVLKLPADDQLAGTGAAQPPVQLQAPAGGPEGLSTAPNAAGPFGPNQNAPLYNDTRFAYTQGEDGYPYGAHVAGGMTWQQSAEAVMPPASSASTPTRHAGWGQAQFAVGMSPRARSAGGGGGGVDTTFQAQAAEVQLESTAAGLTITAPGGATIVAPQDVLTASRDGEEGGSGGLGTTVEVSTASLGDWRHGPAGSGAGLWTASVSGTGEPGSPVALKLLLGASPGGGAPRRGVGGEVVMGSGDATGNGTAGGAQGQGQGVTAQLRGAPVRVRVRFPRHDVTISQPAPQ